MASGDHFFCGLRVRSSLAIATLPGWAGGADAPVDVTIHEGEVPLALADAVTPGRYLAVGADGAVLVQAFDHARFLIRGGREIVVQPLCAKAKDAIGSVLDTLLTLLLHQRGACPVHAAALRVGDGIVAVAGKGGAGKSTLAHRLCQTGFDPLSDDMTVLRDDGDAIRAMPGGPRLQLWRDAIEAAAIPLDRLARVRDGIEKYDVDPGSRFDPTPAPLRAMLLLAEGDAVDLSPVAPTRAIPALQSHILHWRTAHSLGRRRALLAQSAAIAARVPIYRLTQPKRFDLLPGSVDLLARTFGA